MCQDSSVSFFFEKMNKGQLKGPGTSFQSPALSQKHVRNVFHTAHEYLTKFHIGST